MIKMKNTTTPLPILPMSESEKPNYFTRSLKNTNSRFENIIDSQVATSMRFFY